MKIFRNISKRGGEGGFTLLEILIAIGVLAAMTLTMSSIMTGIVEQKNKARDRANLNHSVQMTMAKISDDLRLAFVADKKFFGQDNYYLSGFKGTSSSINFSTMSHVHFLKNKKETDQVHVGYFLKKNEQGNMDLMRRETDHLVDDLEEGGKAFVLLPNVKDVSFEYYDSNKKDWQQSWDTESVSNLGRLPQMVKVTLVVLGAFESAASDERKEKTYQWLVDLPLYNNKILF
ncbi:MAG: hypothetical protein H7A33_06225 [Deltaproteobacteria bacterium]|nr:hypothetical protein [Deltaproteobacteria bacterium]